MSTTAPPQVDPSSIDRTGISVATTVASDPNPRTGTAYDPTTFAAAAPIWFHPMPGGSHLMVNARSWYAATPGGGVGSYTSYTEDLSPTWSVLHGPTGGRRPVPGWGPKIPVNTKTDALALVAAASRAPDHLYLLHSAVIAAQPAALVQLQRVAPGGVSTYSEEVAPSLAVGEHTVVFDKGLQFDTPYLNLYGTDPTGAIYHIRKPWPDLGVNRRQSSGYTPAWEYFTGTGFSTDPTQAVPMPGLRTDGPLSFAAFRHITVLTTVVKAVEPVSTLPLVAFSGAGTLFDGPPAAPNQYTGVFWRSKAGRPWAQAGDPVPLGSDADGSYLGHGVALQPQLETNPLTDAMAGTSAAIPYLVSTKATNAGESALVNTWGLHTIRL